MDEVAAFSLLKTAQVASEINVALQVKAQDQAEAVIGTLLEGAAQSAPTREFHATGQNLNVVA